MLIDVGSDGRVTGCAIGQASGSDVLDRRACEIISERGRFAPRMDPETGQPIAYQTRQRIVWRIED